MTWISGLPTVHIPIRFSIIILIAVLSLSLSLWPLSSCLSLTHTLSLSYCLEFPSYICPSIFTALAKNPLTTWISIYITVVNPSPDTVLANALGKDRDSFKSSGHWWSMIYSRMALLQKVKWNFWIFGHMISCQQNSWQIQSWSHR